MRTFEAYGFAASNVDPTVEKSGGCTAIDSVGDSSRTSSVTANAESVAR